MNENRIYFVLVNYGRFGLAFAERDPSKDMDWQSTIQALAVQEWNDVRSVFEADSTAGTWRDVTDKARLAAELAREGVPFDILC